MTLSVNPAPWSPWDALGIAASGGCIAHCLLGPLLISFAPLAGVAVLESEMTHKALVVSVVFIGFFAFLPGLLRHREFSSMPLILFGVGALVFATTLAEAVFGESGEKIFTALGGGAMVLAHWRNWKSSQLCRTNPL